MRAVKAVCGALAAAIILGIAGPASAGGNWIEWRRRQNVVSKVVVARNIFFARSEAKVKRAGPYYAYITPETYGWQLPNVEKPGTVRLGRVKVIWPGPDSHFRGFLRFNPRARIKFTVPDLPSGNYLITFCNLGCTRTLGDVDPTGGFAIVQSTPEGQLNARLDLMSERFREYRDRARRERVRTALKLADAVSDVERDANFARQRIEALDERISKLRADLRADDSLPWGAIAAAGLIVGATGFLFGSLRRRKFDRGSVDAELHQIIQEEVAGAASRSSH
jgi:hypothetical protein